MTDLTTESVDQGTDLDSLGPVDYVVVEFPEGASNFTGEMAAELVALVDAGTIRLIDVLILTKAEDGAPRRCHGAGYHRRSAHLGKPVGCTVCIGGAAFGWPADRQRTDSDPGNHRLHRGR